MNTPFAARTLIGATTFEHPSLSLLVTDAQRDRAVMYLQEAYTDGRLTALELDERLGRALSARTRGELNAAFVGLVRVSPTSELAGAHPAYSPLVNQQRDGATGRAAAGMAHASSIMFPLVGPGVAYAVTEQGSFARSHAAKAFNFQLFAIVVAIVLGALDWGLVSGLWFGAWLVLTVLGAIKGFSGEEWKNPVMRMVPCKPLDEGTRRSIGR